MTNLPDIVENMLASGLPDRFVLRVSALARESEGVLDMVQLWNEAEADRDAIVAELQAALDDREPSGPPVEVRDCDDLQRAAEARSRLKAQLRTLIEANGGVSHIAKAAGIPQPSLSRFLNTASEPRPATLHRLAQAMGLPVSALSPSDLHESAVYNLEPLKLRRFYDTPSYGVRPIHRAVEVRS